MSKTLNDLTAIELMALSKVVDLRAVNCEKALPQKTSASVKFSVLIEGDICRGEGSERAGTNRARTAEAMVMLLVMSGAVREHSPAKIVEAWRDLGSLDKKAMAQRVASLSDEDRALHDKCLDLFQSEIVGNLPKIPAKGGLKFHAS